jgi:hypothetical protein
VATAGDARKYDRSATVPFGTLKTCVSIALRLETVPDERSES